MSVEFDCCSFFKAVADANRVKIMLLLARGEMSVSAICKHFKMKQPSISHHLGVLKSAKVVECRKEGKEVFYRLNQCCVSSRCSDFMQRFAEKTGKGAAGD
ncbi:MAG: winged helix-turn-helix transcriptional regulator [Elusimicrobia bacterium]|nr:winged helix-turn-helix transcriptional regulator [Elusimicrobiota bacterium]